MNQNSAHINQDSKIHLSDETRRVLMTNSKPTLKRWSNRSPTTDPRWARPKTDHQAPANLTESFFAGVIIKSEAQPTGVQLKRSAKLLSVIGLPTNSGLDVRGFKPPHRRSFCFCARYFCFFNYNVHDIFSILFNK